MCKAAEVNLGRIRAKFGRFRAECGRIWLSSVHQFYSGQLWPTRSQFVSKLRGVGTSLGDISPDLAESGRTRLIPGLICRSIFENVQGPRSGTLIEQCSAKSRDMMLHFQWPTTKVRSKRARIAREVRSVLQLAASGAAVQGGDQVTCDGGATRPAQHACAERGRPGDAQETPHVGNPGATTMQGTRAQSVSTYPSLPLPTPLPPLAWTQRLYETPKHPFGGGGGVKHNPDHVVVHN